MGKAYNQQYHSDAHTQRKGSMQCGACGKPITSGEYRSAQKSANYDWHYVTHHRACCESDPQWAKKDAANVKRQARDEALLRACEVFRSKWDIDDLDDLIDSLTPEPVQSEYEEEDPQ